MAEEEKKESILILPKHIPEAPLTTLDENQSQWFRRNILRRCTIRQLKAGLREATDSYTFGRGDDIDYALMLCYDIEVKEREDNIVFQSGRFQLERKETEQYSLFIKRHSQYIFSSTFEGSENMRYE